MTMKKMTRNITFIFCVFAVLLSSCSSRKPFRDNQQSVYNVADRRSPESADYDKDISESIREDILNDSEIKRFSHVNVTVYNGAVLLTGEVMNEAFKSKIVEAVRIVKNVKIVHDNLVVDYPSDNLSRANDRRIGQNIRQALTQIRTIPDFDSSLVRVITEQGTVYLMGRVHRDEGLVVINVVRTEPDIRQLITVFDYID
jgi:osmotically-inducible protein OsmY